MSRPGTLKIAILYPWSARLRSSQAMSTPREALVTGQFGRRDPLALSATGVDAPPCKRPMFDPPHELSTDFSWSCFAITFGESIA
jgi:hypothetical protein